MNLEVLIKKSIKGSRHHQKELYALLAKDLYGLAKRYSVDNPQAKDYMQDGFLKIFENLHIYDPTKSNLLTWSKTILVNTILSHKRKKSIPIIGIELIPDTYENVEYNQNPFDSDDNRINEIIDTLRSLPDHYRQIINLYFLDGWSHQEIADQLDIKVGTSRSLLSRGKQMLFKKINLKTKTHESKAI